MNKSIVFLLAGISFIQIPVFAQEKVNGKLAFEQGKSYVIESKQDTKVSQEAMGQTIDFTMNGSVKHLFKATNATASNTTLHHEIRQVGLYFEGMGAKQSFDSDNPKDMKGDMSKPVSDLLSKSYDLIIDGNGKTIMARPEKIELAEVNDRAAIIMNAVKELPDLIKPAKKGTSSFFRILPAYDVKIGDTWRDTLLTESQSSLTIYTLSAITDSTIVVDFKASIATSATTEQMGMEIVTKMNSVSEGKVILDKKTKIIKERSSDTNSKGTAEVMGNSMPLTSNMKMVEKVTIE